MQHEKEAFEAELNALRENIPEIIEGERGTRSVRTVPYSLDLARRIVNYLLDGLTLRQISRKGETPDYPTLLSWIKENAEFAALLAGIKAAKAYAYEEAAIETAEGVRDKDDVPAAKLLVDTYKWAAEVNDPAVYGKKLAHSGEVKGNVTLQVITGFGPPNAWQTPPKLKADGTIDAEWEAINGPGAESGEKSSGESSDAKVDGGDQDPREHPAPSPGLPEGAGGDRPPDPPISSSDSPIDGILPL